MVPLDDGMLKNAIWVVLVATSKDILFSIHLSPLGGVPELGLVITMISNYRVMAVEHMKEHMLTCGWRAAIRTHHEYPIF